MGIVGVSARAATGTSWALPEELRTEALVRLLILAARKNGARKWS